MQTALPAIERVNLGSQISYGSALERQRTRRTEVESGGREAVFILEHTPVITLGRQAHDEHLRMSRDALARIGVEVAETDRGGDVTYHGPGQLVAYPILHLERRGLSITGYLRLLEQAVIDALAHFDLHGERLPGYTGVWVKGAKVAAIGVGVYHGVSFHGTAINVNPNMAHWELIVPCGIPDKPVTSLARLLGNPPTIDAVADAFVTCLEKNLNSPTAVRT